MTLSIFWLGYGIVVVFLYVWASQLIREPRLHTNESDLSLKEVVGEADARRDA